MTGEHELVWHLRYRRIAAPVSEVRDCVFKSSLWAVGTMLASPVLIPSRTLVIILDHQKILSLLIVENQEIVLLASICVSNL